MPAYNPPTKVQTREISYQALVNRIEPDHTRLKHREPEYEFTGRRFFGNPERRGAYAED